MLTIKYGPKQDTPRFIFGSLLLNILESDYIALKLLFLEPYTLAHTLLHAQLEFTEKILKFYFCMMTLDESGIEDIVKKGHSLKSLRELCTPLAPIFSEAEIVNFIDPVDTSVMQHVKYGVAKSQASMIHGMETNLGTNMQIIERLFFFSIFNLPDVWKQVFVFHSALKGVVTGSRRDQSFNRDLLVQVIQNKNDAKTPKAPAHYVHHVFNCIVSKRIIGPRSLVSFCNTVPNDLLKEKNDSDRNDDHQSIANQITQFLIQGERKS